jgi:hypothetical protein
MIPPQIKLGLGASIGLFIAMLGCRDAGMVAFNAKTNALKLGDFSQPGPMVALIGLAVALAMQARKIPGAVLAGIAAAALAGIPLGLTKLPHSALSRAPQPDAGRAANRLRWARSASAALPYVFAFFAGEFFSTLGTTLAIGAKAGLTDADGNLPGIERPFLVDSLAAAVGPLIGIPAGTALVESAAGVEAGGRTGLTPITAADPVPGRAVPAAVGHGHPQTGHRAGPDPDRHLDAGHDPPSAQRGITDLLPAMAMVLLTLISNSFGTGIAGGLAGPRHRPGSGRQGAARSLSACSSWPSRLATTSTPPPRTEFVVQGIMTPTPISIGNVPASTLGRETDATLSAGVSAPSPRSNCTATCWARCGARPSRTSSASAARRSPRPRSPPSTSAAPSRSACCACCGRWSATCLLDARRLPPDHL